MFHTSRTQSQNGSSIPCPSTSAELGANPKTRTPPGRNHSPNLKTMEDVSLGEIWKSEYTANTASIAPGDSGVYVLISAF